MNLDELNAMMEKETSSLRDESFHKTVLEISSGNLFPMRKMRRKVIADALLMAGALVVFGLYHYSSGLWWITIPAILFAVFFLLLELVAFRRYWYLEPAANVSEMMLKFSRRFQRVTQQLRLIDIVLTIFIMLLLIVGVMAKNFISFQTLGLLGSLKLLTWLSVRKWNARAKGARMLAKEFNFK